MKRDKLFSLILFFLLFTIQLVLVFKPEFDFNYGWEYGRVAESLLNGNGYGNVWGGNTGPTATMPPVLVIIHLIGLLAFDNLLFSFLFVQGIKFGAYALCFNLILLILKKNDFYVNKYLLFISFVGFIFLSFSTNFNNTGDLWLNSFLITAFLFYFTLFLEKQSTDRLIYLALICFIAPQINSAIALAIVSAIALIILMKIYEKNRDFSIKNRSGFFEGLFCNKQLVKWYNASFILALFFLFSVGIWTVRNYIVFNEFIPSKSNFWLEIYLANIKDKDGRLSYSTVLMYHPINNHHIRDQILESGGEVEWMKQFEKKGRYYLKSNRRDYNKKVINRLKNSFVFTFDDMDIEKTEYLENLFLPDKQKLIEKRLIWNETWVSLDMEEEDFLLTIDQLELLDQEGIVNDWYRASNNFKAKQRAISYIFRGFLFALTPFLIGFYLLFFKKYRSNYLFLAIISMYLAYLIPYVIASHQLRYQRPLMVFQVMLIMMVMDYVTRKIKLSNRLLRTFKVKTIF